MAQNNTIFFLFALLTILCPQSNAVFSQPPSHSLRNAIINLQADPSSPGVFDLKKDSNSSSTFYVEATLLFNSNSSNALTNALGDYQTVKMMISIANNETMASLQTCFGFTEYDCKPPACEILMYEWTTGVYYTDFIVWAYRAPYKSLKLDQDYWRLSTDLFMAYQCFTNVSDSAAIGADRYGILGLGIYNGSYNNFVTSKMFSIYIQSDLNSGKLFFTNATSNYSQSLQPVATLAANMTWQVALSDNHIEVGGKSVALTGNLMFDINSLAIGIPYYNGYFKFLESFMQIPEISSCSNDTSRPTCKTKEDIEDLPDLVLSVNDTKIKIPSQIYATFVKKSGGVSDSA